MRVFPSKLADCKGLMDITKLFEIGHFHIKLSNLPNSALNRFVNWRKNFQFHVEVTSLTSAFVVFGPYGPMHIILPGSINIAIKAIKMLI